MTRYEMEHEYDNAAAMEQTCRNLLFATGNQSWAERADYWRKCAEEWAEKLRRLQDTERSL